MLLYVLPTIFWVLTETLGFVRPSIVENASDLQSVVGTPPGCFRSVKEEGSVLVCRSLGALRKLEVWLQNRKFRFVGSVTWRATGGLNIKVTVT